MMYSMMGGSGSSTLFPLLWAIHIASVFLFLVGIVLLTAWAIKSLSHEKLKRLGVWLVLIGTVLCLFTVAMKGSLWGGGRQGMMFGRGMMVDRAEMQKLSDSMMDYPAKPNDAAYSSMRSLMEKMMGDDDEEVK